MWYWASHPVSLGGSLWDAVPFPSQCILFPVLSSKEIVHGNVCVLSLQWVLPTFLQILTSRWHPSLDSVLGQFSHLVVLWPLPLACVPVHIGDRTLVPSSHLQKSSTHKAPAHMSVWHLLNPVLMAYTCTLKLIMFSVNDFFKCLFFPADHELLEWRVPLFIFKNWAF